LGVLRSLQGRPAVSCGVLRCPAVSCGFQAYRHFVMFLTLRKFVNSLRALRWLETPL